MSFFLNCQPGNFAGPFLFLINPNKKPPVFSQNERLLHSTWCVINVVAAHTKLMNMSKFCKSEMIVNSGTKGLRQHKVLLLDDS